MLDGSFILATSVIHLITVVPACLLGFTKAKVMLNSLIHYPPTRIMEMIDPGV